MSAAVSDCSPLDYEAALGMLSSLIVWRKGDTFHLMFDYLKILELDEFISELKVIHVAGTKGKGSTCAFAESILRNCGFRTGLLTSPHLIDVRERICLDGVKVSKDKFSSYFLWCWNRLKEKTGEIPMPDFFHFLTLLGLKIFTAEKVDVAILEVSLGGRLDSTNVVQQPIVCGISSLGYDHMEILGYTLAKIAEEKAGIFKNGVPAFTVAQPDEAMYVLEDRASQLSVFLQVSQPLDVSLLNGSTLGLDGDHQYLNAGLAVALCRTWLEKTGHSKDIQLNQASLPVEFLRGLATAKLHGRAQVVVDPITSMEGIGRLVFFLDGAHSPESMEVCAKWFCGAVEKDLRQHAFSNNLHYDERSIDSIQNEVPKNDSMQILLFNCTKERDPMVLVPPLVDTCSKDGIYFKKAIFVPSVPAFNKVRGNSFPVDDTNVVDLSWQRTIQQAWQKITLHGDKVACGKIGENSYVFQSMPLALEWLRDIASENQSTRLHVLVTGSLALVGDLLGVLKN